MRLENNCGRSSGVTAKGVQSEIASHLQRAQAIWIAPDCCTSYKTGSPIPGQIIYPNHCARQRIGQAPAAAAVASSRPKAAENIPALVAKDRQPRSVAERSLLLEHNDGIAFVEEAPRISTKRRIGVQQLGITGTLVDTLLWNYGFLTQASGVRTPLMRRSGPM